MKTRMILSMAMACASASLAQAAAPLDPETLGKLDAAIAFCHTLHPDGEPGYKALRASMVGKLSEPALEALTRSPEYRAALENGARELSGEPRESALQDCKALAPAPARSARKENDAHKHP
jgi:hypothetical protein